MPSGPMTPATVWKSFVAWIANGGLVPFLAVVAGIAFHSVASLQPHLLPPTAYGPLTVSFNLLIAAFWWRAIRTLRPGSPIRRPAFVVFAAGLVWLVSSALVVVGGVRGSLVQVIGVLAWAACPLLVTALLLWPRALGSHLRRQYLAIDVGIISIAVVLFVWYVRFGPSAHGAASTDELGVLTTSAVLLAGLSLAVL